MRNDESFLNNMQIIEDDWLERLPNRFQLQEKRILEIGCGCGFISLQLGKACKSLVAIDCDPCALEEARRVRSATNIEYLEATAQSLPFEDRTFDMAIFSNSFHHIPGSLQETAILETVRVLIDEAMVIMLEPGFSGALFEAEKLFHAGDKDERFEKMFAYQTMLSSPNLQEVTEYYAEKKLSFESAKDFIDSLNASKGTTKEIETFLETHAFALRAEKRVNIFKSLRTRHT